MDQSTSNPYVSRAGYKLEQANTKFKINFKDQAVLDVGSSTGGFTDYALKHGAKQIFAVELGTNQLVNQLRLSDKIELHEKADILDVKPYHANGFGLKLKDVPDIVLVDLSFISLKKILPHIQTLINKNSKLIVLVKPQFEARAIDKNDGIIKNEAIRRRVLKDFETWVKKQYVILNKTDAIISGTKGNKERFYLLLKAQARNK